jgi:predicted DNA-binding protein (MmcQ/YjbR family)
MDIEVLREICFSFPGVIEDIKWENHLCFCVGEKMFLICGLDETPVTASFKTDPEDFEKLSSVKGFKPAPYLARAGWIHASDIRLLSEKQWKVLAKKSYQLILSKMPKKFRLSLEK